MKFRVFVAVLAASQVAAGAAKQRHGREVARLGQGPITGHEVVLLVIEVVEEAPDGGELVGDVA